MLNQRHNAIKTWLLGVLFLTSLMTCIGLGHLPATAIDPGNESAVAQSHPLSPIHTESGHAAQQVQTGVGYYQNGAFQSAIASWQIALETYRENGNLENAAIVLENLARAYQALGHTDQEIRYWQQATAAYQQLQNLQQVGRMLTEQAQAYSRQGQYRQATALLCNAAASQPCAESSAVRIAEDTGDRLGEAAALGSLGEAYRLQGDYGRAIDQFEKSLMIAEELENLTYQTSSLQGLGNAYVNLAQVSYRQAEASEQIEEGEDAAAFRTEGRNSDAEALNYLQTALQHTQTQHDDLGEVRALLSIVPIYYRTGAIENGEAALEQAISTWNRLPNSQDKIYLVLKLAQFVQSPPIADVLVSRRGCENSTINPDAKALLEQSVTLSQTLGNPRAESFALGELGHLYECAGNYAQALELTRQAQLAADQDLQAQDSLYLWQWQAGRIFKAQGNIPDAIRAYEEATTTLKTIQDDIVLASRDIRFDFRDTVEPVYRELVELRLLQAQPSIVISSTEQRTSLDRVLTTLDTLKLAELQNYFGNDCVLTALSQGIETLVSADHPNVVVFSTVVLDDRTAVILSFRDSQQQLKQQFEWIKDDYGNYIGQNALIEEVNQYRQGLERFRDAIGAANFSGYNPEQAQRLYDWIIRPFLPILRNQAIETLVFVQDGIFRSIPMAALHDGEQFLVENYALGTTPSLNLTNLGPPERRRLRALALGLTERAVVEGRAFPELTYVSSEIQAIQERLPNSKELLNQEFTRDRLQQELNVSTYPIIHIATHGRFSAEAENAFLVTGHDVNSQSQKLTINDLDDIIRDASARSPVELLVLSACQTAAGDDRAALGLAGIAAQAGARSVLASLWSVNDQSTTQLVTQFYDGLFAAEMSKAKALQMAQRSLIEAGGRTAHPAYWSAFILIGNWL